MLNTSSIVITTEANGRSVGFREDRRTMSVNESDGEYYYVNGKRVPLYVESDVFAVRFKDDDRGAVDRLSPERRRLVDENAERVERIEEYGIDVYRVSDSAGPTATESPVERAVESLDEEREVEFATRAFRQSPKSDDLMFVTNRFSVQFKADVPEQEIEQFNREHGVRVLDELEYLHGGYVLEAPAGDGTRGPIALANEYYESGLVEFATPDLVRRVHFKNSAVHLYERSRSVDADEAPSLFAELRRSVGDDARPIGVIVEKPSTIHETRSADESAGTEPPYLDRQWHLRTAKVTDAWSETRGASSIAVAVLDDGIDVEHPEFSGRVVAQYDFERGEPDGSPKHPSDNHGTACAGVAVAGGQKAAGVAPECSLVAVRTPGYLGTVDEARMFHWTATNGADVISCSWGPADRGGPFPLTDNVRAAIRYCVAEGRDGKGIPVLFAAGNGNESVSEDGYAASEYVVAVAASTSEEVRSYYSDYGPEILVCAPSSGIPGWGELSVFTTDRRGSAGYNPGDVDEGDAEGDYTNSFGGTSSATPLVAGIVGLMLSVNPDLTVEEVKTVLRTTSDRIGPASSYDGNGHSQLYGYGRVNAMRAVREAKDRLDIRSELSDQTDKPMMGTAESRERDERLWREAGPVPGADR